MLAQINPGSQKPADEDRLRGVQRDRCFPRGGDDSPSRNTKRPAKAQSAMSIISPMNSGNSLIFGVSERCSCQCCPGRGEATYLPYADVNRAKKTATTERRTSRKSTRTTFMVGLGGSVGRSFFQPQAPTPN